MVNYQQGKIYKIENSIGLIYIGSTTKKYLCERLAQHKASFKRYKEGKYNYITSFKLFENNEQPNITLIELCPCNSKDELHKMERENIEKYECVNKIIQSRSTKEYYEDYKDEILNQQN